MYESGVGSGVVTFKWSYIISKKNDTIGRCSNNQEMPIPIQKTYLHTHKYIHTYTHTFKHTQYIYT